jgi:hypothetical protein
MNSITPSNAIPFEVLKNAFASGEVGKIYSMVTLDGADAEHLLARIDLCRNAMEDVISHTDQDKKLNFIKLETEIIGALNSYITNTISYTIRYLFAVGMSKKDIMSCIQRDPLTRDITQIIKPEYLTDLLSKNSYVYSWLKEAAQSGLRNAQEKRESINAFFATGEARYDALNTLIWTKVRENILREDGSEEIVKTIQFIEDGIPSHLKKNIRTVKKHF